MAPEKRTLAVAVGAMVAGSLGNFCLPAFVSFLIDRHSRTSKAEPDTLLKRLCGNMSDAQFLGLSAGVFAASGFASFLRTYLVGLVTARTARRMRKEAFEAVVCSEMDFFDTDEVGRCAAGVG